MDKTSKNRKTSYAVTGNANHVVKNVSRSETTLEHLDFNSLCAIHFFNVYTQMNFVFNLQSYRNY